jgi:hypothetical protein
VGIASPDALRPEQASLKEGWMQRMMKVLGDASLGVESIHFSEAELNGYVKAASAAEKSAPPPFT